MSDSTGMIDNTIGVSSDLLYKCKPSSAPCKTIRLSLPSANSQAFIAGQTMSFFIPSGRRNVSMDSVATSFLKFTVNNFDAKYIYVDNLCTSFIQRLDIYQGSVLLESIQGFNIYASYLADFSMTMSAKSGNSVNYGCCNPRLPNTSRSGIPIVNGGKYTFTMPILGSSIFNTCDTNFPIGKLSDDLRVEFTLENNDAACVYTSAAARVPWTITYPELIVNLIEQSDLGQQIVNSSITTENIFIHGSTIKSTVATLPIGSQGTFSYLLPFRYASIKNLVILPRSVTTSANALAYSISSRVNPNIAYWNIRCGATQYPMKSIVLGSTNSGGYSEQFTEILKSFHMLNSIYGTAITSSNFNVNEFAEPNNNIKRPSENGVAAINNTALGGYDIAAVPADPFLSHENAFALAIELESYSNRSSTILSGINTRGLTTYFEGSHHTTGALTASYTLNIFCQHDIVFLIDQTGLITVIF